MTLCDSVTGEFFFWIVREISVSSKMEKIWLPKHILFIFTDLTVGGKQQQTVFIHM